MMRCWGLLIWLTLPLPSITIGSRRLMRRFKRLWIETMTTDATALNQPEQ
jgi:hypothetical protein